MGGPNNYYYYAIFITPINGAILHSMTGLRDGRLKKSKRSGN